MDKQHPADTTKVFKLNATLDEAFDVYIQGTEKITESDPGQFLMGDYSRDKLDMINCDWYRNVTESNMPALKITFVPRTVGSAFVVGYVQLSRINPLYIKIKYDITISRKD